MYRPVQVSDMTSTLQYPELSYAWAILNWDPLKSTKINLAGNDLPSMNQLVKHQMLQCCFYQWSCGHVTMVVM